MNEPITRAIDVLNEWDPNATVVFWGADAEGENGWLLADALEHHLFDGYRLTRVKRVEGEIGTEVWYDWGDRWMAAKYRPTPDGLVREEPTPEDQERTARLFTLAAL